MWVDKWYYFKYNDNTKVAFCNINREVNETSTSKIGMTIDEAAEVSGIGRNTMRKLISWGKLPVLLVGRKKIIRSDTLERFMTANQGRNLLNQSEVRKVE